jgi:hypothetical protein
VLSWCGDEDVVGQGDKVLIYLLASMFLPTFDIRFSLHSDRASRARTCKPRHTGQLHSVTSIAVVINNHLCA